MVRAAEGGGVLEAADLAVRNFQLPIPIGKCSQWATNNQQNNVKWRRISFHFSKIHVGHLLLCGRHFFPFPSAVSGPAHMQIEMSLY